MIAALGWDVLDPDEVHREYRRRPADNPVDYALLLSRTPRLFIEAKGLGENIDDPKWANQTISYAAVAGVEWVALTDGAEWRLYNAHAPVPVEQKLFRAVRVAEDLDAAFELLALLSKDNLRDNRLQELWRGFFVDRQVHAALDELFNTGEPARDLVALVAKRVPDLPRADIRASLVRARVAFDFPTPSLPLTWILEQRIEPWLIAGRHASPQPHPVPGNGSSDVKPTAAWGRFAEHESIAAPVARSSNGTCPGRQGLAHRSPGARHGLSASRTAWAIARSCSAISPLSFGRSSGPLAWEQRD